MTKKITPKRLENIALYYLQRYESSTFRLQEVLKRRIRRAKMQEIEVTDEADKWVNDVVRHMQELGYIDDRRYAENIFRRLHGSNKSIRFIVGKLKQDGIDTDIINTLMEEQNTTSDEMDLASARRLVDKKKLGFHHR